MYNIWIIALRVKSNPSTTLMFVDPSLIPVHLNLISFKHWSHPRGLFVTARVHSQNSLHREKDRREFVTGLKCFFRFRSLFLFASWFRLSALLPRRCGSKKSQRFALISQPGLFRMKLVQLFWLATPINLHDWHLNWSISESVSFCF